MVREKVRRLFSLVGVAALFLPVVVSVALLAAGATTFVALSPAQAKLAYAKETKLSCTRCHTSSKGGAENLTDFGMKFQANGHKLPPK
jgi:hypothetical protein